MIVLLSNKEDIPYMFILKQVNNSAFENQKKVDIWTALG